MAGVFIRAGYHRPCFAHPFRAIGRNPSPRCLREAWDRLAVHGENLDSRLARDAQPSSNPCGFQNDGIETATQYSLGRMMAFLLSFYLGSQNSNNPAIYLSRVEHYCLPQSSPCPRIPPTALYPHRHPLPLAPPKLLSLKPSQSVTSRATLSPLSPPSTTTNHANVPSKLLYLSSIPSVAMAILSEPKRWDGISKPRMFSGWTTRINQSGQIPTMPQPEPSMSRRLP